MVQPWLSKKLHIIISGLMLTLAVTVKISNFSLVEQWQSDVFDSYQRFFPRAYSDQPVKIVDIDDESLARIGQWPWPREKLAQLIYILHDVGAAAVAMDIVFSEADRYSPNQLLAEMPQGKQIALLLDGKIPDYDALFADAIQDTNTVTGFVLTEKKAGVSPELKAGFAYAGHNPAVHTMEFKGAVTSLLALESAAAGNGALNSAPDKDGTLRKLPLLFSLNESIYPSLVAEALRVAQGASSYTVKTAGASSEKDFGTDSGITDIKIGSLAIPTNAAGQLWMYYTPYKEERYIPAWKILSKKFDPALVAGNIVLIGTSAAGLKDMRSTPLNPVTSGVEVHAQAIEQIVSGMFLNRPDWMLGAEILLMVLGGILLINVMTMLPAVWGAVYTTVVLACAWGFSFYAFRTFGLLVEPLTPCLAIILVYVTESLSKYVSTEHEKRHIRNAFSHYMSPALVKELAANPDKLKLGGEVRQLTVLFCDIRGFTSISERMNAEQLTTFINRFLTPMTRVILDHKGTIDKYIGDCIMAFWNAPLDDPEHEVNACRAALGMFKELEVLNRSGQWDFTVQIGIGINSGSCCVGNMGSDMRFDYSVLGDDVNLASRLEGQSKTYGMNIVIGETTKERLSDMAMLELDMIQVKGKEQPVRIYGLLGDETLYHNINFLHLKQDFEKCLQRYREQAWVQAESLLQTCRQHCKKLEGIDLEGLFTLYMERIEYYRKQKLPANWDGVYKAKTK